MLPDTRHTLETLFRNALAEDIGSGDHSSLSCIPAGERGKAVLKVKQDCVLAGTDLARMIFELDAPEVVFEPLAIDGEEMIDGSQAFLVETTVHSLLRCERLVLNTMQRMSGIATLTRSYVELLEGYKTKILDTRKTTPNFRLPEKMAVRIGGAYNHRFGLYDMIMLKDNHIDFAGGIVEAVERAHAYVQSLEKPLLIEVETRSLADVELMLKHSIGKVFRIMLDNFTPEQCHTAVKMIERQIETEASGGINKNTLLRYAETGVDYVSIGGLIHQAQSVDLSLKALH